MWREVSRSSLFKDPLGTCVRSCVCFASRFPWGPNNGARLAHFHARLMERPRVRPEVVVAGVPTSLRTLDHPFDASRLVIALTQLIQDIVFENDGPRLGVATPSCPRIASAFVFNCPKIGARRQQSAGARILLRLTANEDISTILIFHSEDVSYTEYCNFSPTLVEEKF